MDIGGIAIEIAIAPSVVRTSTGSISSATSGNITLDCTGGDLVVIGWSAFDTTLADRTASTVTVGGASATIVAGSKADNTTSNGQAQLAYYIAPSTGSQTVTLTMGGTCTNVDWYASLVTGANQSGQPDVQGQNTTTAGTSCTVTVTTVANNALLFDAMNGNVGPMTPNASQTSIMNLSGSTGRGSYKTSGTAGSYSMIYTTAGSDDYALGVIAIAKVSSSSTTYPGYYGSGGYF